MKKFSRPKKMPLSVFFLLLVLCISMSSCLNWFLEEPSVNVRKISISPRSLKEMNLLFGIEVHNPNRFDLTLTSFKYKIYLNNEEIGSGNLVKEVLLPASSTELIQVPVAATFKNIEKSLKMIVTGKKDLLYTIKGTAHIKMFLGSKSFPLLKEGKIRDLGW